MVDLRDAGVLHELREAAGLSDDATLPVLTNFGQVVEVDADALTVREIDDDELPDLIVPQTVLDELAFLAFDIDFAEVFGDEFASDDLPEEDDLVFAAADRLGTSYLVLADVGDVRRKDQELYDLLR